MPASIPVRRAPEPGGPVPRHALNMRIIILGNSRPPKVSILHDAIRGEKEAFDAGRCDENKQFYVARSTQSIQRRGGFTDDVDAGVWRRQRTSTSSARKLIWTQRFYVCETQFEKQGEPCLQPCTARSDSPPAQTQPVEYLLLCPTRNDLA